MPTLQTENEQELLVLANHTHKHLDLILHDLMAYILKWEDIVAKQQTPEYANHADTIFRTARAEHSAAAFLLREHAGTIDAAKHAIQFPSTARDLLDTAAAQRRIAWELQRSASDRVFEIEIELLNQND